MGCRRLSEPATKERRPGVFLPPLKGPALRGAAGRGTRSANAELHRDGSADAGHVISQTRKQPHVSLKGRRDPASCSSPHPC